VVRVVLQVQGNGFGDSGIREDLLGLVQAGLSGVAVSVLEGLVGAEEAAGNVGVQGQVGALVDLVCNGLPVNKVGHGLANSECLGWDLPLLPWCRTAWCRS
jgi:hypothetical protein